MLKTVTAVQAAPFEPPMPQPTCVEYPARGGVRHCAGCTVCGSQLESKYHGRQSEATITQDEAHKRQKSPAEIRYCCSGLRSRWDSICLLVWHDDLFTSVVFVCPVVAKTDRTQHCLSAHAGPARRGLACNIMSARAKRCLTCHQVQRVERRRGHQVHRGIHRNNRGRTSPMATVAVYV